MEQWEGLVCHDGRRLIPAQMSQGVQTRESSDSSVEENLVLPCDVEIVVMTATRLESEKARDLVRQAD